VIKGNVLFEEYIIEKLKSGDKDSFSYIFSAYYRDLVFFAYSFIHELACAEDIVQDTFVKLWEERENLSVTVALKSILMKTVQNKCIDWHRHKKIIEKHTAFVTDNSSLYENDCDSYVLRSELEGRINKAIADLPEKYKEAFKMNRFEGFKYHEIAEKLHVSVRTVEVRIGNALELLRKSLIDFTR
jgi:RNA polymerase sigma-70 factor (family 1)